MATHAAIWLSQKGIPIRNLWVLLVHASALASLLGDQFADVDDDAELADLLGLLLAEAVERRLRRGLGRGYVMKTGALTRVRGRIDWLATESGQQLRRGRVTCRYQDLTFDRPRNRLCRAALSALASRVAGGSLRGRLKDLEGVLASWGVVATRPSRAELLGDMPAPREVDDQLMIEAALLALDLVLPAEAEGRTRITQLARDEALLRRIFEAGVAGYLRHHVHGHDGWTVRPQRTLTWQIAAATPGIASVMPGMISDIILECGHRRIVVDTKFTTMLAPRQHGGDALKSGHIYQLYTYLRSQEGRSTAADQAEGLLLYPSNGPAQDEAVEIQGHRLRFASIDLTLPARDFGSALRTIVCG